MNLAGFTVSAHQILDQKQKITKLLLKLDPHVVSKYLQGECDNKAHDHHTKLLIVLYLSAECFKCAT